MIQTVQRVHHDRWRTGAAFTSANMRRLGGSGPDPVVRRANMAGRYL